jgi:hypothetical protein
MGGNTSTFNHTAAAAWTWANTQPATSSVKTQLSPPHLLAGQCWNGTSNITQPVYASIQYLPGSGSGPNILKFTNTRCSDASGYDLIQFDTLTFGAGAQSALFLANAGKTAWFGTAPGSGYAFTGPNSLAMIANPSDMNMEDYAFVTKTTVAHKELATLIQGNWTAGANTPGNIACLTGDNTVGNCPTAAANANELGVFVNAGADIATSGIATVNLDASVTAAAGDNVCFSTTTASVSHENGTTQCAAGSRVGIVSHTSGSASTSATVFISPR